jgi:hypothetical protein
LIHDFVVHRAAEKWMRVANHRSHFRRTLARTPQYGLQAPGGPI